MPPSRSLTSSNISTPPAATLFTTHQNDCLVQLLLPPFTLNRYANITTQDVLARADVQAAFSVSKLGASAPRAPMLLFHGRLDEVIPYEVGKQLRDRYCALGASVEWQTYEIAEHVVGSVITAPSALAWLSERLGGQPVPDDCAAVRAATRRAARKRAAARQRRCVAKRRAAGRSRAQARRACVRGGGESPRRWGLRRGDARNAWRG